MKPQCILVNVSGPVSSGKSAIAATIRVILENHGYCVAIPDKSERLNPSSPIATAAPHEAPTVNNTVIVITEECL